MAAGQSAATGDYDQAAKVLVDMRDILRKGEQTHINQILRETIATVASELALSATANAQLLRLLMQNNRGVLAEAYDSILFRRTEQADLHVVAGALALEQGQATEAMGQFEQALALCPTDAGPAARFAGRPLAEAQERRFRAVRK